MPKSSLSRSEPIGGGYIWRDAEPEDAHSYLCPEVLRLLALKTLASVDRRLFDLGCGNGSLTSVIADHGWQTIGIDVSEDGIHQARLAHPALRFEVGNVYDDLVEKYGQFPVVLSLEVVEHVYSPQRYAETLHSLVSKGGVAIVSTPYHGYWKNLAMALSGRLDAHFTALWENGHIKFWSMKTLGMLLKEAGFRDVTFSRVGRVPALAKSMVAVASK